MQKRNRILPPILFPPTETEEDILLQYLSLLGYDDYPALRVAPNGYNGHGSTTPIGDMVDDYQMSDGTPFDWSNSTHAANPYANREPRLYASILYEGAQWRERPSDVRGIDPFGKIQVGLVVNTSGQTVKGGLDNREGPYQYFQWRLYRILSTQSGRYQL